MLTYCQLVLLATTEVVRAPQIGRAAVEGADDVDPVGHVEQALLTVAEDALQADGPVDRGIDPRGRLVHAAAGVGAGVDPGRCPDGGTRTLGGATAGGGLPAGGGGGETRIQG